MINGTFQAHCSDKKEIANLSATIIRGLTGPTGSSSSYSASNVNLANGITGVNGDIQYIPDTINIQDSLNSSLWSFSVIDTNSTTVNAITPIMTIIDTPGNTGPRYYTMRVNTDAVSADKLSFYNSKFSIIKVKD